MRSTGSVCADQTDHGLVQFGNSNVLNSGKNEDFCNKHTISALHPRVATLVPTFVPLLYAKPSEVFAEGLGSLLVAGAGSSLPLVTVGTAGFHISKNTFKFTDIRLELKPGAGN